MTRPPDQSDLPDGKLTLEQREKFAAHINSKSALIGKCPVCSARQWSILDHFLNGIVFYPGGGMVIGGPSYPHVGLICGHCGNTQLINAVVAGILPGDRVDELVEEPSTKGEQQ